MLLRRTLSILLTAGCLPLLSARALRAQVDPVPPAGGESAPAADVAPVPDAPTPPAAEEAPAEPATSSEVAAAAEPAPAFGIFYRKKRFGGRALNTSIYVDGVEIAELDPGTYIKVPLAPGKHSLHSDEEKDAFDVTVAPGQDYYFAVNLKAGMWKGHGKLEQRSRDEGAAEFEKLDMKPCKADAIKHPESVVIDPRKPGKSED